MCPVVAPGPLWFADVGGEGFEEARRRALAGGFILTHPRLFPEHFKTLSVMVLMRLSAACAERELTQHIGRALWGDAGEMRPPLFSSATRGLAEPIQYLHRARMFMDATLGMVDYANGEVNWPKYALLLQSIELALKAYCLNRFAAGQAMERAPNHNLMAWYEIAGRCGLPLDSVLANNLAILSPFHLDHTARYPNSRRPIEMPYIAAETAEAVIAAVSPTILSQ